MKHEQRHNTLRGLRARAEDPVADWATARRQAHVDNMERELSLRELMLRMQNDQLQQLSDEVCGISERYADLFMSAPIAYLVLDSHANIVRANIAAARLLGVEHARLGGMKLSRFMRAEPAASFVQHMHAVLESEGMHKIELELLRCNGDQREVRFESRRDERRPNEWRATIIDLTDMRQLERERDQARTLESIGAHTAGLAHDFGNLLYLVSMGVDLALEASAVPADAKSALVRAQRTIQTGRRIVRDLTRYAAAHRPGEPTLVSVDSAIGDVVPELQRLSGTRVALEVRLDAPEAQTSLDVGALEEMLLNLAINALHAMPEGGSLVIETSTCLGRDAHAQQRPPGPPGQRYVVLSVADTGCGMDAETRKRALEPFFTTKRGTGTGLGLPMVQAIVTRAGGWMQLESEFEEGTTVSLYLPICEPS